MTRIAVYFQYEGAYGYPFNETRYLISHRQLSDKIDALGGSYWIVRHPETYLGHGRFSKSWRFKDGSLVESGPVTADVIFDKGCFAADDFHAVFNCREINDICTDKWATYNRFESLSPPTFLARTDAEYGQALASVTGDTVVVKPVDGLQGEGVFIRPRTELQKAPIPFPAIVQGFLNTQNGIPGLVNGIHDFRITMLNGEVICALIRTPPRGELIAAVARGADMRVIERAAIPRTFVDLALRVDADLAHYGQRLISTDMALTPDGPKLIELNSRVALREDEIHPAFANLKQKLARVLVSLANRTDVD
jgi:glutathione synthase/RimK-type ligase-like ATP-grasp enzyme